MGFRVVVDSNVVQNVVFGNQSLWSRNVVNFCFQKHVINKGYTVKLIYSKNIMGFALVQIYIQFGTHV